jgi:peroxiredoxin
MHGIRAAVDAEGPPRRLEGDVMTAFRTEPNPVARILGLSLALALVALGPLTGCGTAPSDGGSSPKTVGATGASADDVAPDFTLPDLDGTEFTLSETTGQVRLLDFWATWCAPCREELPMLQRLNETYGPQGFAMIAISDEDPEQIRKFVEDQGITYRNLVDSGDVAEEFLVLGLPTGLLIDRDGRIVERFVGPKPQSVLERRIQELLEQSPAG